MESINVTETILDKKLEGYGFEQKNFKASSELTVEITLSEYRELVGKDATAKYRVDEANNDKYARENRISALEKENANLKAELYELRKKLDIEESEEE